ncbi:hypothetical protein F4561_005949 [Lipingzhangella halophila]|uniref:Uncharacterized protein n=1 Tax=Lipingzhangella halophila TaxID=1783352 RepID=A0A7W7W6P4_9ACTN|nr:hypothetical protein [Lipingzhangella halophila]MBB4935055.1 hypothetical protein [Lipingzhangella halophila]
MTTGDEQHRWWQCYRGHVFEHGPVPEGEQLQCPEYDADGWCGTSFVFMPFPSREAAEAGLIIGRPRWAPWAG